jgi:hypothetical protein
MNIGDFSAADLQHRLSFQPMSGASLHTPILAYAIGYDRKFAALRAVILG